MADSEHASGLERRAREGPESRPPIHAATVILLRDAAEGLETLMLRRDSKIVFGGMWVFPGGRVEADDWAGVSEGDELEAARRAAAREALEECGLAVDPERMAPFSHWTPPPITPKRFLTWFFAASATRGEVTIDDSEIREHEWMAPVVALERQAAGQIDLAPPTFVSLFELSAFGSVDEALEHVRARMPERFQTRLGVADVGPVALWHGDAGYEVADPGAVGERHRLTMPKGGQWRYERSARPET